MRGGIAEKGGVRVGHRIIEINSEFLCILEMSVFEPVTSKNVNLIYFFR